MWIKNYKDYPSDSMIKQEQVSSGSGIVGCEMHEQMGYGSSHDLPKKKKPGIVLTFLLKLWGFAKINSKFLGARGKDRSKRSDLNEERMARAMGDEEDRSGKAAADQKRGNYLRKAPRRQ